MMDVGGLDVKLGLRLMRKSWGLTLVGGVAMALTIGLGTAIFTLWNTATAPTLPLSDGDRIVAIQSADVATQQIHRDSSLPDFRRWREFLRSVTDVSAMRLVERTLITPGGASGPITVAEMTASAFRLARVQPMLGRPLLDDDERDGANVVVIGFELWQAGFSSDPAVIGRRLQLDDVYYVVVGVMPQAFAFPVSQRIWIPLRTHASDYSRDPPLDVFVFARLAQGFTLENAQSEVVTLGLSAHDRGERRNQPDQSQGPFPPRLRPRVVPYVTGLFTIDASRRWTGSVVLLLAALLLLPPCANIAILVYARAVTRREEFAVAVRARRNPKPHRRTDFRRGTRAGGGSRHRWIPPGARVRRADLETRFAGHGTGERPFLVRFQSFAEYGALPGRTGCRRRRDRWRRPRSATDGTVADWAPYTG